MVEKIKVINFLQDFGCARLNQLQILYNDEKNNFKSVLSGRMVSKKDDIFVHNTKKIDEKMLVALEILCKYKSKLVKYYRNRKPIFITFLTKDNLLYHIIVADEENQEGIVKFINCSLLIPQVDKLILAFPNRDELENINCEIPFLYTTYPGLEVINC